MKILIKNAAIVTMNQHREIINYGYLILNDGVITHIGEDFHPACNSNYDKMINAQGKVVFPGLINTHTHLFQNFLKGRGDDKPLENWWPSVIGPFAANMTPELAYLGAMCGGLEAVRSGTTTLVDFMYAHPQPGISDATIAALSDLGVRSVYARGFRNTGASRGFPQNLIESIDTVFDEVLSLKKKHENETALTHIWLAPTAIWGLTLEALKETRTFCSRHKVPLTMHILETNTDNLVTQQMYNKQAVKVFEESGILGPDLLAVHCVSVTSTEINIFKKYNVKISHNPVSNMFLASGISPVPEMLDAGLIISLGTDGAASNNSLDMIETMKITALLHKVHSLNPTAVTAEQVLEMATIQGAKALGLDSLIGSLEIGKRADLFIFNPLKAKPCPVSNPISSLIYSSSIDSVETVLVNGKVILENGIFQTVEEESYLQRMTDFWSNYKNQ
ncbi:MAG: amidohydrolase [Bacillota bacterium]